jgi:hypothetical protein
VNALQQMPQRALCVVGLLLRLRSWFIPEACPTCNWVGDRKHQQVTRGSAASWVNRVADTQLPGWQHQLLYAASALGTCSTMPSPRVWSLCKEAC